MFLLQYSYVGMIKFINFFWFPRQQVRSFFLLHDPHVVLGEEVVDDTVETHGAVGGGRLAGRSLGG